MNAEEIMLSAKMCQERKCGDCPRITNAFHLEDDCRRDLVGCLVSMIESLKYDAANYQQIKKALSREGFSDIETMIARFKQVMIDENSISAARELEMDGLSEKLKASERMARNARNELCLKCGRYHEAHNGACDGCKWKEMSL